MTLRLLILNYYLAVLVDDTLFLFAGSQIGVTDEQGDLVVLVQILPQLLGEGVDVGRNADSFRFSHSSLVKSTMS